MAAFPAIFIVTLLFDSIYALALRDENENKLIWPEEYHFTGDITELHNGIVLPFDLWYSSEFGRSRIDLDEGTVSQFYNLNTVDEKEFYYGIHPVSDRSFYSEWVCYKPNIDLNYLHLLLDADGFEYINDTMQEGEEWTNTKTHTDSLNETYTRIQTFYVILTDEGYHLPSEYVEKIYSEERGLQQHTVIHYNSFDSDFIEDDLIIPVEDPQVNCVEEQGGLRINNDWKVVDNLLPVPVNSDNHHSRKHSNKPKKTNAQNKLKNHIFAGNPFSYSEEQLAQKVKDLPWSFDLREEGVVTPVKNQGSHCSSNWAFAVTGALEIAYGRSAGIYQLDLSEQALIDCSWGYFSQGCEGGSARLAAEFLKDQGIPTESEYGGYVGIDGECRILDMSNYYDIRHITNLPSNNSNAIKLALYDYGPVIITVNTESISDYTSGIFMDESDGEHNHPVIVVGFVVREDEDYFIVKNSWGDRWGEGGYMRMSTKSGYSDPFILNL